MGHSSAVQFRTDDLDSPVSRYVVLLGRGERWIGGTACCLAYGALTLQKHLPHHDRVLFQVRVNGPHSPLWKIIHTNDSMSEQHAQDSNHLLVTPLCLASGCSLPPFYGKLPLSLSLSKFQQYQFLFDAMPVEMLYWDVYEGLSALNVWRNVHGKFFLNMIFLLFKMISWMILFMFCGWL